MKCTINDINLSFDKDNRLRKTIYRVSKHDVDKAYALASFFSDKDFIKFLLKNIKQTDILKGETVSFEELTKSDFAKINQNRLGDLLNLYYIEHYHSVHNTKTNKGMGNLNGFSTASAKTVAKTYNAQLIIEEYRKELSKPDNKRRKPLQIIKDVNNRLLNTLYERTTAFATHVLNSSEYSKEAKDYAQQYIDIIKSINSVIADNEKDESFKSSLESILKERTKELEEVIKQGNVAIDNKDLKTAKSLNKRNKTLREEIKNLQNDIAVIKKRLDARKSDGELFMNKYVIAQNLINLYANKSDSVLGVRLRNFANLVAQTRGDADAWYFQVFNTKKMTDVIKEFNKVEDIEEYLEEQDGNNDDIISKYNNQGIDETSKTWEDHLYKSFNQTINGKLKLILSSIPKLSQKYNTNDDVQAIDTNNELGVPTFMDSQFLTVQIYSFGDFSSVNSLIESLEYKCNNIKAIHGLGQVVNMMKARKDFANFVYANFAKPIVNKTILSIENLSEDGITFEYSNPNAFPLTELVFRMANKLKAVYNSSYDEQDISKLNSILNNYNKTKDKNKLTKDLFDIVTKYFPNFNKDTFTNYFDNTLNNNIDENVKILIRSLSDVINGIKALKATINSEERRLIDKYNAEIKQYYEDLTIYNTTKGKPGVKVTKPTFPRREHINYSKYDLNSATYSAIIKFAKQIVNYTESKARLNTANANGNNASDVVKNCFITRFFEQILAESKENSDIGVKNLLTYITQGTENGKDNQYSNNPLFFGVKNENGVIVAPGMFTRTATGYEINPNAKQILKANLFDGSKNTQDKNSATYSEMSKIDFFITEFIAFRDSVEELTDRGKTKKVGNLDTAVYPMRIGSDAPKIYFIRAPKYNNTQIHYAFYDHLINELTMFTKGLTKLFVDEGNGVYRNRINTEGLIGRAFYNERVVEELKQKGATDFTSAFVKNGKLVGNLFKFNRLFKVNNYDAGAMIESMLSLYGGVDGNGLINFDEDGRIRLVPNDIIIRKGDEFVLNLSNDNKKELLNIVKNWCNELLIDAKSRSEGLLNILKDNNIQYTDSLFNNFILNSVNMNMNYDDLFEGDYKYYQSARDFLKRTKESQAGGDGYAGYDLLEDPTKGIHQLTWNNKPEVIQVDSNTQFDENNSPVREDVTINGRQLIVKNGWRAVTIYNTNKASDYADQLQKELESIFIKQGIPNDIALSRSILIAQGYGFSAADRRGDTTKINDAQSYITLEEFIRRRHADGTIQDYADLIKVLTDDTPVDKINLEDINARIQVQKNFYFDKVYDKDTGLYYPRQIKNAEFVLIPKLLPEGSELRKVYDWMDKNGIGQLNTAETSKAAKKSIFTIWDSKTGEFNENFEKDFNPGYIEDYYYQYLYKQQDVPQHLVDTKNKLGSQIAKKIIDNIINENDSDNPNRDRLIKLANEYQDAYTANIEEDFNNFLDAMGWNYDIETGKFTNATYPTTDAYGNKLPDDVIENNKNTLNFDNFYSRAREEAARLGMDSNFMEYLNPNEFGVPTMPNWMSIVTNKLESIAQSIYNSRITRQTLPGWHAAQITGVGYSKKLEFDPKTGVMQVYLPRWSNLIPKDKNAIYKTVTSYYWEDSTDETKTIDEFETNIKKLANGQKVIFEYYDGYNNSTTDPKRKVSKDKAFQVAAYIIHDEEYANKLIKRANLNYTLEEFLHKSEIETFTDNSIEKKLITDIYKLTGDEAILAQIESEGLDIHLGYRIPTEGKQSVAILKVVGFTNECLGSTIVVPNEWVTQTGSDFDVDSVYGISWEMYATKDKQGKISLHKIPFDESTTNDIDLYIKYVNDRLENSITRTDIGTEIQNSISNLKNELNSFNERKESNKNFAEIDKKRNDLFRTELPNWARGIIKANNKNPKFIQKGEESKVDLRELYERINNELKHYLDKHNIDEEVKEIVYRYIDAQTGLIEIMNLQEGLPVFDKDIYLSKKAEVIEELVQKAKNDYFEKIKEKAKEVNILDFEKFKELPFVKKLSRRARNNYIIDRMIKIMEDDTSREEQYGRSKFDAITNGKDGANDIIDRLYNQSSRERSPYNNLDQLDYFEDAMGGARLKALSVNWDTFTSKNNKVRATLDESDAVQVILNVDGKSVEDSVITYNEESIRDSYKDDIVDYEEKDNKRKVIFNARRLGWSDDNRNIVGELVTTYTSQTTAHHLDAVKMGSVPNVDEYTFNTYKFLSTLGIDFENVIAFIRQPIITELVTNNNLINSVFISSRNNPIRMTLADIANNLKLKDGKNKITHYTKVDNIIEALKFDNNLSSTFESLFGIDISKMTNEDILNIKVPLDKERMFTRIKRKANNVGNAYENAAFDLAMLLTFRNIKITADKVNKLVSTTNADKVGAPSSIREGRKLIMQINELRADKTLSKNDVPFIELIYPSINGDYNKIDIEKSEYKSIAAVYQYVTLASTQTNTKLFKMEDIDFATTEEIIQDAIRHRFTEAEYKEYKRYAVSTLYNQVQKLLTPLTVNDRGIIIPDNKRIEELNNKDSINQYWDEERSRIYGYDISTDGIFEPDNLNEPTEDDIIKFNKLSPAQKVLFIQKHFPDNQGIFNYIKVTLFNNTDAKYRGITRQYLAYDDQVDNIEDLFELFIKSFANHNKFIKLATIDLIKYAFIAEGFNFKSSYISKIIPNSVLYTSSKDGGMDIINNLDANNSLTTMIDNLAYQMRSDEFIENFVRSHSEMIKVTRFLNYEEETNDFISLIRKDGVIHIDMTSDNDLIKNIIYKLGITNRSFVKINYPISSYRIKSETVLFKVEPRNEILDTKGKVLGFKDYFLVPLNLLDKYETYDYSYNKNYNIFNSREYYNTIVENLSKSVESARERKEDDPTVIANKEVKAERIPVGAYTINDINLFDNEYGLMELYEHGDDYTKGGIKKLLDGVKNHIETTENGINENYIQFNNSSRLNRLIPKGKQVEQIITLDDNNQLEVTISHISVTPKVLKTINSLTTGTNTNENSIEMQNLKLAIGEMNKAMVLPEHANFYRVTRTKKSKEDNNDKALKAATELIIDPSEDFGTNVKLSTRRSKIDIVSSSMMNEISYEARKNNTAIAKRFVDDLRRHGVNKHMGSTITENRENIYKSAARYYRAAANSIINRLEKFTMLNENNEMTEYSMDEEAMYKALIYHDEYFGEVASIILDGITFGNRIADIFKLDLTAEDKEIKDSIEIIINSINSVRQNKKLADAMNNIINIYFKKYSTNPEIMRGILQLRETFGDLDVIDAWIADPADIDNNEVQTIIKQVYSMFNKAELFDAKKNLKEFKDKVAEIEAMSDGMNINNVIDFENFKIKAEYNDEFLKDRQKLFDNLNESRENKNNSVEDFAKYIKAKYELDEFLYKYTEQPIIGTYYEEDLKLRKTVMYDAGDVYIKYLYLTNELYNINKNIDDDSKIAKEKQRILTELNWLRSEVDIVGNEKPDIDKVRALNKFINGRLKLQEQYFNNTEYEGFQENYERYKKYIEDYDKRKPYDSLEQKLENTQYKEAYDWINTNGKIIFGKEESTKLKIAFNRLKGYSTVLSKNTMLNLKRIPGIIDDAGNIDATKLTDEQIEELRKEEENELVKIYEDTGGEIILIKDIPNNIPIGFKTNSPVKKNKNNELPAAKFEIIGKINKIIGKTIDRFTGNINVVTLFDNSIVSDEERNELIELYKELKRIDDLNNNFVPNSRFKPKYTEEINKTAFFNAMNYYRTNLQNTAQGRQFLNIFTVLDRKGNITANPYIYGYKEPTEDNIDHDRTNARKYIEDNVEFVTTKYYEIAKHQAEEQGEEAFNDWFNKNHIYNPYSHRYEPLKVWTELKAKPGSDLDKSIRYAPTFENIERSVRNEYINNTENRKRLGIDGDGYKEFNINYKKGDGKYDSGIILTSKEKALKDLLVQTMNKYATTYQGKRFVGQGYLPRERKTNITTRWVGGQLLALGGISWHSGVESDDFYDKVDYTHDREAIMDMLTLIKAKGTKDYLSIPDRAEFDSEIEYNKKVAEIREENRKIQKENEAIDKVNVNKNWKEVMEDFVYNATIFNSRQAAKPYLYLLLEDLAVNNAYMIKGMWNKSLVKDYDKSTDDDTIYKTIPQTRTREVVHTLTRRLLFEQHHKNSTPRAIANFLQNMTSAKYMVFNLYGGIANITTGLSNIVMEEAANEYFGIEEFSKASNSYLKNSVQMLANMYSDTAPNKTVAFIKEFNIVNFDQVLQFGASSDSVDENLKRVRNWLYSFQSVGEHYMQNSVLLAMLNSNRLYTDRKGVKRIGDFKDFTWDIEQQAMEEVLSSNEHLLNHYKLYLESIAYDTKEKLNLDTGRKDFNRNYLYSLRDSSNKSVQELYKTIAAAYHKKRDKLLKNAKKEFVKNRTIESIYKFNESTGMLELDKEVIANFNNSGKNIIGDLEHLIGGFKSKVEKVNQKIHGVYDKIGAAQLETKWFGSIVMQYHKHLYTGIFKRWRRKGYYSEFRGSRERGSYQTFIDFLGTEFTNFKGRIKNKTNNDENVVLASLQVTMQSLLNTFINLQFNYNNLSTWERANLNRYKAELVGPLVACLIVMALYGLDDEDDIKDDTFKSSLLYLADRLYSDTTMYSPMGLITEAKTAWSSPIASANGPSDLIKSMQLITQALFDPDYNPNYQSGQYAGKNKLTVLLRRNIPGIRPYDRIQFITRNNKYYKVGETQIGINIAKNLGEAMNE